LTGAPPTNSGNDPGTRPAQAAGNPPPPQRVRVVEGLDEGETIVGSGALGLFNEMEAQGR
jgi:hypothetical protein